MPPFEWGGGGGAIHHRAFRSCGEKPPPYSSTPNSTPILSLEGEGAIHHRALWICGKMPLTLWKVHPPLPIQKIDVSQVVNSKIHVLKRDGDGEGESTMGLFDAVVKCPLLPLHPLNFGKWWGGGGGGKGGAIDHRAFRTWGWSEWRCGKIPPHSFPHTPIQIGAGRGPFTTGHSKAVDSGEMPPSPTFPIPK